MRPTTEALTIEFRAIAARKLASNETFDPDILSFWELEGVDVNGILSEVATD